MINYYFKYLELLDTVFLALKKKPLGMSFNWTGSFIYSTSGSFLACFPPLCDCFVMFYATQWENECGIYPREPRKPPMLTIHCSQSWVVISLNLTVHVIMCKLPTIRSSAQYTKVMYTQIIIITRAPEERRSGYVSTFTFLEL